MCIQRTHFLYDDCENTWSYYHRRQIRYMTHWIAIKFVCGVEDDASTMMFTDFIQLAVISKLYKKRLHTATHITQDVLTKPFVSEQKYSESTDNGIHNFVYFF